MDGESKDDYMKRMKKKMYDKSHDMKKGCVKKAYTVRQDEMEKSYLGAEGDPHGSRSMLKENIVGKPYSVKKAPSTTKTKRSYKEQQEYAGLEEEIANLETEKAALEEEINSGKLDYELLNSKAIRIAELIQEIDSKMERWMDLDQLS